MLAVVIMAAGKGTRMKSDLPKVLHVLGGQSLIDYVLKTAEQLHPDRLVIIVGHKHEEVRKHIGNRAIFVRQEPQLGTGHAVQQVEEALNDFEGDVVVLTGDAPLLRAGTLQKMQDEHNKVKAVATVLSAIALNPFGYGRIVRDEAGRFLRIVEEKDATPEEKAIAEVNSGVYFFDSALLFSTLKQVKPNNSKGEFYLTDVIGLLKDSGKTVQAVKLADYYEIRGINTVEELQDAEKRFHSANTVERT
jgi:UDP-N-acetylglucosamine diphosphorylase/glucosamine-1-phosphate N-acetyltransferase